MEPSYHGVKPGTHGLHVFRIGHPIPLHSIQE
jgi:hypothetical protein